MLHEEKSNPAVPSITTAEKPKEVRKRIPMSVPIRKLEVPEREGWHRYWFIGNNVPRAIQGGYKHVHTHEIPINQHNPANDPSVTGSQGLGSLVEITDGLDEHGKSTTLYLMEIEMEFWLEDQKILEKRNANIMQSIFRGEQIMGTESLSPEEKSLMYVDPDKTRASTPLFKRRPRKV